MKSTIIFKAESKSVPPLILECVFTCWPEVPVTYPAGGGAPEQGEPAGCEVESVECVDMDVDKNVRVPRPLLVRQIIGELCWQADHAQIERLVMEAASDEAQGDPDRYRD